MLDHGIYSDKEWPAPDKGQAAMITRMDRDTGVMMDRLKEVGIDENTLIIFTSDDGHLREGGNNPEFFDANGPFHGMKRELYERGIRLSVIALDNQELVAKTVAFMDDAHRPSPNWKPYGKRREIPDVGVGELPF